MISTWYFLVILIVFGVPTLLLTYAFFNSLWSNSFGALLDYNRHVLKGAEQHYEKMKEFPQHYKPKSIEDFKEHYSYLKPRLRAFSGLLFIVPVGAFAGYMTYLTFTYVQPSLLPLWKALISL